MEGVEGCFNETAIEGGVFITTPEGTRQVDKESLKVVDGKIYMEVKCCLKLRTLCGADHPRAFNLEDNAFLGTLRKSRYDATTALLSAAHAASWDPSVGPAPSKFVRKHLFDEIKTTVDVVCPAYRAFGTDVPACTIGMLTAQYHNSRVWFELSPENFDYVRLGVRHTMFDVPSRKRKDKNSPPDFVGCAAARLRDDRRAVYSRVRNADGKWSLKTFPVKFSDVHEFFTERQMNAAMEAQRHYDACHVPAPRRKYPGPRARGSRDG